MLILIIESMHNNIIINLSTKNERTPNSDQHARSQQIQVR